MKTTLYLGLKPPEDKIHYLHCPIIKTILHPPENSDIQLGFQSIPKYTHIIITSKTAARYFFQHLSHFKFNSQDLLNKTFIAVGKKTADTLTENGIKKILIAEQETSEGIVSTLHQLQNTYVFWPHSQLSRPIISQFLKKQAIPFQECILYTTITQIPTPVPNLDHFQEIIFTSPSTVDAFLEIYKALPSDKILTTIGPITRAKLAGIDSSRASS